MTSKYDASLTIEERRSEFPCRGTGSIRSRFFRIREEAPHPPLGSLINLNCRHAWIAVQASQIHVGYGDADIDLLYADPLRLTPFPGDREAWGAGDSAAQLS